MRSPVERMIDEACGIPDGPEVVDGRAADGEWLILYCPLCHRLQATERQSWDPTTATVLDLGCPECTGSDYDLVTYYDAAGNEVRP